MHISHFYSNDRINFRLTGSKLTIDSSTFLNCVSDSEGGAIYCYSSNELKIISCCFHCCKTNSKGGAFFRHLILF